jgi:hypothetical protein
MIRRAEEAKKALRAPSGPQCMYAAISTCGVGQKYSEPANLLSHGLDVCELR